jgi:site-specific DNA-methyltransferase (adenine-specific)
METNVIYNESCIETMKRMADKSVDLTVTSPPYDNLRDYHGYTFDFESIAKELYRVTKDGGVVVWVVADATIKGSETGTSFKQALFFKECGFNLHDTMIYEKSGGGAVGSNKAYWQYFEYMFVFSKGIINTYNLISDKQNKMFGQMGLGIDKYAKDGHIRTRKIKPYKEFSRRSNIWKYNTGCFTTDDKNSHPAKFPEKLANDHIISWSNEGDTVYDPFMGSGTTAKMALKNKRNFIGSEISKEYCDIALNRIANAQQTLL